MEQRQQQHFLVVAYPAQGHVNPALHLAKRLAADTGAAVTLSTAVSGHRRMFPSSAGEEEVFDGLISFIPHSDGYDEGFKRGVDDYNEVRPRNKLFGTKTLAAIVESLAARGRPVTCIIYTLLPCWAADVARDHGIPSALYWIQPAAVFAIYYHYFHGYGSHIITHANDSMSTVELPGLPPLKVGDLPSFFTITNPDDPYIVVLDMFKETFDTLDKEQSGSSKPRVLVNTFDELEPDAIHAVDKVDLLGIGPLVPTQVTDVEKNPKKNTTTTISAGDLFKPDEKGYMEWLDSKPVKSVVYVSFGSLSVLKKRQLEEIIYGLKESARPYLWVVRKDNRGEGVELEEGENGMVVEWCSQVKVLSHPSVGCFVTHCGWNSTVESLVCGVPEVAVPQFSDQATIARMMEEWGTGVRSQVNKEGVLEGEELKRCLEVVMGEGERGVEIRRKAEMWKRKAEEARGEGGSSDRNLRAFLAEIGRNK